MINSDYWLNRYQTKETNWDAGEITTPIKEYVDQLSDKSITILIPGCGNAHEAAYLWQQGFKNIFLLDYVAEPLNNFIQQFPDFPKEQLILKDFFELNGKFDLIIEQTFFCALDPALRANYVKKMHDLLKPSGKLAGVLFNNYFEKEGPPFGGDESEYKSLLNELFEIKLIETCYNSIPPRKGNELFIICTPKNVENNH